MTDSFDGAKKGVETVATLVGALKDSKHGGQVLNDVGLIVSTITGVVALPFAGLNRAVESPPLFH